MMWKNIRCFICVTIAICPFWRVKTCVPVKSKEKHHVAHICLIEYDQHTPLNWDCSMQNNQDIYGNMSYPAFLNGVVERLDEPSNWRA